MQGLKKREEEEYKQRQETQRLINRLQNQREDINRFNEKIQNIQEHTQYFGPLNNPRFNNVFNLNSKKIDEAEELLDPRNKQTLKTVTNYLGWDHIWWFLHYIFYGFTKKPVSYIIKWPSKK